MIHDMSTLKPWTWVQEDGVKHRLWIAGLIIGTFVEAILFYGAQPCSPPFVGVGSFVCFLFLLPAFLPVNLVSALLQAMGVYSIPVISTVVWIGMLATTFVFNALFFGIIFSLPLFVMLRIYRFLHAKQD